MYDAPGHLFAADERAELAHLLEMAIYMGWDTFVAARPFRVLVQLSHHDFIVLHARSSPSAVVRKLQRLGLQRDDGGRAPGTDPRG